MSLKCPKCSKTMSSRQRLQSHLSKPVPCDFACKICEFKSNKRCQFDYHMKSKHPKAKVLLDVDNQARTRLPKAKVLLDIDNQARTRLPVDIIPLQDFNKEYMDMLINYANTNSDVKMLEIAVKPFMDRALNALKISDYATSLECFNMNFYDTAAKILGQIHLDDERLEMHSIKLTDVTRVRISIYSRPTENSAAEWLSFDKAAALNILSKHASKILIFTLMKAILSLELKYCEQEEEVCYCLYNPDNQRNVIIYDPDPQDIFMSYDTPKPAVKFYNGNLVDVPQTPECFDQVEQLNYLMRKKTTHILSYLDKLVLTGKDIKSFLEQTRRPLIIE